MIDCLDCGRIFKSKRAVRAHSASCLMRKKQEKHDDV